MAEKKVPIDEAVRQISDSLSHHASNIQNLQQNLETTRSKLDNQFTTLREEMQQEMRTLESKLNMAINSKESQWSELSNKMHALTTGLVELKQLIQARPTVPPPRPPNLSPETTAFTAHHSSNTPQASLDHSPLNLNDSIQHTTHMIPKTIVLPPASSIPTFSGKSTDRPRQFLLRVVEYTRTVNHWSTDTLLQGISQFLKDSALEWYCQLYITNNLPVTWTQFVSRFLAQFHSPIRIAQQETEWSECKQQENETINEFVVRLRSLWLEHKKDEDEPDFIKHLFCKMRPDMLTLMNNCRSSSLDDIVTEAQKVEEILYLRNKEQRLCNLMKKSSSTSSNNIPSLLSLPGKTSNSTRITNSTSNSQFTPTCWRCYAPGHYATTCPLNDPKSTTQTHDYQPRSKNP